MEKKYQQRVASRAPSAAKKLFEKNRNSLLPLKEIKVESTRKKDKNSGIKTCVAWFR